MTFEQRNLFTHLLLYKEEYSIYLRYLSRGNNSAIIMFAPLFYRGQLVNEKIAPDKVGI